MIGGVEMVGDREVALAVAVEGLVAGRRDDPIVPAHVAEVDVERPTLTDVAAVFSSVAATAAGRSPRAVGVPNRPLLVAPVVGVGEEKRLRLRPALGTLVYASS
jgi:hypothetical protein